MDQTLRSEILGTGALAVLAFVSAVLAIRRRPIPTCDAERRRTAAVFVCLVLIQAAHAGEEYTTRFFEAFPKTLGLVPWPAAFFLTLNLSWIAIWAISAPGLRTGSRVALFPVWFLALAAVANGIAHPLLALQARGYFPGLITSPLVGIGGVVLLKHVTSITEPSRDHGSYRDFVTSVGRWIPGRARHLIEETEVTEVTD